MGGPVSGLLALVIVLGADPPATSPPSTEALPRSSIAAVLEHRGELGLGDRLVKQLEERDAALQKQLTELRGRYPAMGFRGRDAGWQPGDGVTPPMSPTTPAQPDGTGGGGGHRGGMSHRLGSGGRGGAAPDAAARAAALQTQMDDADTAAWLDAEALLPEALREKARAIAEKYREALADARQAPSTGH